MKKLILMAGLMMISLQAKLCAQTYYEKLATTSKTEQTFDNKLMFTAIRSFVTLKDGKLIVEVANADDYVAMKNLDSILVQFMKDISFYRDSVAANPTAHYRMDYVLNDGYSFKKIRFKKYNADGDIYMNRDGEVAKLKFEQDTVNIIIQKAMPGSSKTNPCLISYNARATFLVSNYTDINKIIAGKELSKVIDTLEKVSRKKEGKHKRYLWDPYTIVYNPYFSQGSLSIRKGLRNTEWSYVNVPDLITFNPRIGIGVLRSTLTPVADIGIQLNTGYWNDFKNYTFIRLSGSGYYFFDRTADGKNLVNDNWFINASVGTVEEAGGRRGWPGRVSDFGVGYLLSSKGGYFKNTTFKAFTDLSFVKGITISPELIFTNNFKQVFPGITVTLGH